MVNLDNVVFAMGGKGAYFFNAPTQWSRSNLPSAMEAEFANDKVADVSLACLGEDPDTEFFFNYIEKDGDKRTEMNFHGSSIPAALRSYCYDSDGKWTKNKSLQVVLGPNKSFIAWDETSIRWSNLPADLESLIQGWLSPQGWKKGPPRLLALGKDEAYLAVSEYGAYGYQIPRAKWPVLARELDIMIERKLITEIEKVFFNPALSDSFVCVMKNTRVFGNGYISSIQSYRTVAGSFASAEMKAIYEAEWEEARKKQEEERRKKEDSDNRRKKRESAEAEAQQKQKKKEEADRRALRLAYLAWKKQCDSLFKAGVIITEFPSLPFEACTCEIQACWVRKIEKMLFACRHDVERLLRASGEYSLVWLRAERLAWHPDRFGRKCSIEVKEDFSRRATELYAIFEELIAAETSK